METSQDYKPTDLDYLIGDHHLQMMKAALPYLSVSKQRALSLLVKVQELRRTYELFNDEEVATMGICSLEHPSPSENPKEMLGAIRPYASPKEQELIDLASGFMDGQAPIEQLMGFLSPDQQSRLENAQIFMSALSAMN